MVRFVKVNNRIINLDQLAEAKYRPQRGASVSELELKFAVTESCGGMEEDAGRTPYTVILRGAEAENFWDALCEGVMTV